MKMRWLQRAASLLGLNEAAEAERTLQRAYARFRQVDPDWTASLFDWHFLTHRGRPILSELRAGFADATAARLAQAWAEQWNLRDGFQRRAAARAMPAARRFVSLFQAERHRLPDPAGELQTEANGPFRPAQPTGPAVGHLAHPLESDEEDRWFDSGPRARRAGIEPGEAYRNLRGRSRDRADRRRLLLAASRQEPAGPSPFDRLLARIGRRLSRWGQALESRAQRPVSPECKELLT